MHLLKHTFCSMLYLNRLLPSVSHKVLTQRQDYVLSSECLLCQHQGLEKCLISKSNDSTTPVRQELMSMESKHAPSSPGLSARPLGGLAFTILLSLSLQLAVLPVCLLWETFFDSLHQQDG